MNKEFIKYMQESTREQYNIGPFTKLNNTSKVVLRYCNKHNIEDNDLILCLYDYIRTDFKHRKKNTKTKNRTYKLDRYTILRYVVH